MLWTKQKKLRTPYQLLLIKVYGAFRRHSLFPQFSSLMLGNKVFVIVEIRIKRIQPKHNCKIKKKYRTLK